MTDKYEVVHVRCPECGRTWKMELCEKNHIFCCGDYDHATVLGEDMEVLSSEQVSEMKGYVTVPRHVYESWIEDSKFIKALEDAGVDSWSGYDLALELLGNSELQHDQ